MTSAPGLVLAALISWFAYWGHAAFSALEERQAAEQRWFDADARQDWARADRYRLEARRNTEAIAADVAAGLGLPLVLLGCAEVGRVRRLRRARAERSS